MAVHTVAPGTVWIVVEFGTGAFAATQSPFPQSLKDSQKGEHVAVRASHQVPAGQASSLVHAPYFLYVLAASGAHFVAPVLVSAMVQRSFALQSSASCFSRQLTGPPELLELLEPLDEDELELLLDEDELDAVAPSPPVPAPPVP